jgi:hypothetical protein
MVKVFRLEAAKTRDAEDREHRRKTLCHGGGGSGFP